MIVQSTRWNLLALAAALLAMLVSQHAWPQAPAREVLLRADFEGDTTGWRQVGRADFGLDSSVCSDGRKAARITVSPDEEPRYEVPQSV